MSENNGSKLSKFWKEWMRPIFVVLIITSAFRSAVADWNDVPTGSMKPTILEGDRIFVNKLAYDLKIPFTTTRLAKWADPKRGDIVVLYSPADQKRLVKCVMGLPSDRIELRNGGLYVNGTAAVYEPLDSSLQTEISENQHLQYGFYTESIDGTTHPVLVMPWRPSFRNLELEVIPAGSYFVMGDNRDNSFDSRGFGFVRRESILGRATAVVASVNPDQHYFPRWHRFFTTLR
jgi:signal peptidase I